MDPWTGRVDEFRWKRHLRAGLRLVMLHHESRRYVRREPTRFDELSDRISWLGSVNLVLIYEQLVYI